MVGATVQFDGEQSLFVGHGSCTADGHTDVRQRFPVRLVLHNATDHIQLLCLHHREGGSHDEEYNKSFHRHLGWFM